MWPGSRTLTVKCAAAQGPGPGSASEGSGPSGKHWPRGGGKRDGAKKARTPGLYEVRVVTPPPRSLGIYALPPNTACGEEIDVEGSSYVVTTVVLQYKLRGGKYVRDHNRLDVQPTGRWLVNQMLEGLIRARYVGPTGSQD